MAPFLLSFVVILVIIAAIFSLHHNHIHIRTPASVAMIYKRESKFDIRQRGDLAGEE